jgi:hypothetical protein
VRLYYPNEAVPRLTVGAHDAVYSVQWCPHSPTEVPVYRPVYVIYPCHDQHIPPFSAQTGYDVAALQCTTPRPYSVQFASVGGDGGLRLWDVRNPTQVCIHSTALHRTVFALYCTGLYCTALYCTALYCSVLHGVCCDSCVCTVSGCGVAVWYRFVGHLAETCGLYLDTGNSNTDVCPGQYFSVPAVLLDPKPILYYVL